MKTDEGLLRAVGVRGLTAAIINYTIASGIFVLPAAVSGKVGNAAPLIYIICALAMVLVVMCFAEAGSRVSLSGGTYAYAGVAFGPYVGFMVAMLLWFGSNVLAAAAVANACLDTLANFSPMFTDKPVRALFIVGVYAIFAWINIIGVKSGSRTVQAVTAAKLIPIAVLLIVGVFAVHPANLTWPGVPSVGDTARASVMLIFAFMGVESALTPSGEVRDPARTVPRAIFIALAATTLIYIALQIVSQGILGPDLVTNQSAPLAEAASRVMGTAGRSLILAGASVAMLGFLSGDVLASPRALFAMSRDGLLPSALSSVHEKYKTPYVAILAHCVCCVGLAVSGSFAGLLVLSVLSALIVYLVCCLAVIQLRRKNIRSEGAIPFSVPGGPVVPVLASAIILFLMSGTTRKEYLAIGILILIQTLIYFVMRAVRAAPAPTSNPT